MKQQAITERVKFLIKHIIGKGIASNQEELGKLLGIKNKSYFSQLVSGQRNNENLINSLLNFTPDFNKEWLYNNDIKTPFLSQENETSLLLDKKIDEGIKQIEQNTTILIEKLKRDTEFYSSLADSRLETIKTQNKVIETLGKLIDRLELELNTK